MKDFAFLIQNHKDGISEAAGVVEAFEHSLCSFGIGIVFLTRIVVYVDINKVFA